MNNEGSERELTKAKFQEKIIEMRVPGTRSLFEAIKCLVEFADIVRKLRINEARRLSHVHIFREPSMQKGILNINLADGPAGGDGKEES